MRSPSRWTAGWGEATDAFDTIIDRHPGAELAVMARRTSWSSAATWKLSWDNAADGLHATFAHHSYNTLGKTADVETVLARDPRSTPMVSKALRNGHMGSGPAPGHPQGPWAPCANVPFREHWSQRWSMPAPPNCSTWPPAAW